MNLLLQNPWAHPLASYGLEGTGRLRVPRPAAYIFHKILVAPRRSIAVKTAKDLYYAFYVLDAFPLWRRAILAELAGFGTTQKRSAEAAAAYIESLFSDIDALGVDLLASQRPSTTYGHLSEDQFKLYGLHRMKEIAQALSGIA